MLLRHLCCSCLCCSCDGGSGRFGCVAGVGFAAIIHGGGAAVAALAVHTSLCFRRVCHLLRLSPSRFPPPRENADTLHDAFCTVAIHDAIGAPLPSSPDSCPDPPHRVFSIHPRDAANKEVFKSRAARGLLSKDLPLASRAWAGGAAARPLHLVRFECLTRIANFLSLHAKEQLVVGGQIFGPVCLAGRLCFSSLRVPLLVVAFVSLCSVTHDPLL